MKNLLVSATLLAVVSLVGCQAAVGTSGIISVPKDASSTCGGYCAEMGMSLASVVVMANNVGCVCNPKDAPARAQASGAAAGGMAAILIAQQQQQQQQPSRR